MIRAIVQLFITKEASYAEFKNTQIKINSLHFKINFILANSIVAMVAIIVLIICAGSLSFAISGITVYSNWFADSMAPM